MNSEIGNDTTKIMLYFNKQIARYRYKYMFILNFTDMIDALIRATFNLLFVA